MINEYYKNVFDMTKAQYDVLSNFIDKFNSTKSAQQESNNDRDNTKVESASIKLAPIKKRDRKKSSKSDL